ncbi:MAG: hypothetical protein PHW80_04060 [Smithellaceae bacterium]|nr:hypothetical protein [Smithellaceae bacterium]MDD3260137.1 hypothetical protein [Smithellaceae bacterium]MDD3848454.1 hypothetical protein [Smithellaceae bacterium]HOQ71253.1 hypothetical protein [Smithellaceae bacterium]HPL09914.1 hypothetical protein [Smithellaceae bacterium]
MKYPLPAILFTLLILAPQAGAWHDKTHLAAARAGGLDSWYNAAGPDLAKIKAGNVESYNHWFNNNAGAEVTAGMVMDQIERYNQRNKELDSEGHVYGAIIASLRAYDKDLRAGKYARYHLAYCAHYLTDLSQPLHNIAYDDFNQAFHDRNDGIVEAVILDEPHLITRHMYRITLSDETFEADLAREIARIANLSRLLGYRLRAENRVMTKEEACVQLGHSASLIRAVLRRYP